MVLASNIININTNTTLDAIYNTYIVDASSNNIIITLPNITADGYNFFLKRIDNSNNTVTIQGTGGQTIDGNTSIRLPQLINMDIQSLNNQWYVVISKLGEDLQISLHIDGSKVINSTTYTSINYARFVYKGSNYYGNIPVIMKISFSLNSGSVSSSFTVKLVNLSVTPNQDIAIITATATTSPTTYLIASTNNFINVPANESVIDIQARLNSAGNPNVLLYTVYVKFN